MVIKRHRTGDVTRIEAADAPFGVALYRKRFWYPTARDRLRGALRTTWLARSRVEREAANLERLAGWGMQPRLLLASGERRRRGVLHDSFLCTRALDASPLDRELRDASPERRLALLDALGRFVATLHAHGFVDRDLHLRNLLATADGAIVKIDSPFGSVVRWGREAAQRRELAALAAEIARLVPAEERDALTRAYAAARERDGG